MKKLLFGILFISLTLVVLTSCKDEWKVKVASGIAEAGAPVVAKVFTCENTEKIKEDLNEKLLTLKILKPKGQPKSMVGATLCIAAVKAVIPKLIDFGAQKLPTEWNCSGLALESVGQTLAGDICSKLPF